MTVFTEDSEKSIRITPYGKEVLESLEKSIGETTVDLFTYAQDCVLISLDRMGFVGSQKTLETDLINAKITYSLKGRIPDDYYKDAIGYLMDYKAIEEIEGENKKGS